MNPIFHRSPSDSTPRSAGGRWRIPVALALALGSVTLWTPPANAEPVDGGACLFATWGGYWKIGSSADMTGTLETGLVLEWSTTGNSTEMTLQFYTTSSCAGAPDRVLPTNVCLVFTADGWSPSSDDSYSYEYVSSTETAISPVLDEIYVSDDFEVELHPGLFIEPQELYVQWSQVDPPAGNKTLTLTFTSRNQDGTCTPGGTDDEPGGRRPNIDLDYYIERAAAEASSLPNTL
jgi:hypothetical protein